METVYHCLSKLDKVSTDICGHAKKDVKGLVQYLNADCTLKAHELLVNQMVQYVVICLLELVKRARVSLAHSLMIKLLQPVDQDFMV